MSGMDGFTAGVLLEAAALPGAGDKVADMYKFLMGQGKTGAAVAAKIADAISRGFLRGARVRAAYDKGHLEDAAVGVVTGYNDSTHGLYDGERYPIKAVFERGGFEWGADELVLMDEPGKLITGPIANSELYSLWVLALNDLGLYPFQFDYTAFWVDFVEMESKPGVISQSIFTGTSLKKMTGKRFKCTEVQTQRTVYEVDTAAFSQYVKDTLDKYRRQKAAS